MDIDLIVVDGPNAFNIVARESRSIANGDELFVGQYLREWFDFDRLLYQTLGSSEEPPRGLWLVHSSKPLGGGGYRLKQSETEAFWRRQVSISGCVESEVTIPGEQTETHPFACSACGADNEGKSTSEKGVDASVITHLFEMAPHYRSACIFANDADYTPAIRALTRMGKTVRCIGRKVPGAAVALQRASHHFLEIDCEWLKRDMSTYALLREGGGLDHLLERLQEEIRGFVIAPGPHAPDQLQLVVKADAAPASPEPWNWICSGLYAPSPWAHRERIIDLNSSLRSIPLCFSGLSMPGLDRYLVHNQPRWLARRTTSLESLN